MFYTPQTEEIAWASGQVRSDNYLLALMVQLKCFNRMGYFPRLDDVPEAVVAHIRRDLGLGEDVAAVYDSDRTRGHHRMLIRRRSEVVSDMPAARAVAASPPRKFAWLDLLPVSPAASAARAPGFWRRHGRGGVVATVRAEGPGGSSGWVRRAAVAR